MVGMTQTILDLIQQLDKNATPDVVLYENLLHCIDFTIDANYLSFIKEYNGAGGFVGESFIYLWSIEDVIKLNPYYADDERTFSLLFFGSNGGMCGYAFDKTTGNILEVDWIGLDTILMGSTFEEFLSHL
ncbi:MAG: SMI1/KNR4 family protein [Sphingobacteriales bacterium JAD_PAG50586_3]|nr:MAG: SMI1/KNR4 family protein [Sphingobacteriales bacterium JAD_PAG50586_3]